MRARQPDKRPLVDLINLVTQGHQPPAKAAAYAPPMPSIPHLAPSLPMIDPATLAALSPALSLLSAATTTTTASGSSTPRITEGPSSRTMGHVEPSQESINRPRPGLHRLLYCALPLQCKICAMRYPDTTDGQGRLQAHLDEHFRRNMKLKELNKKVLTRDWFSPEQDWILGTEQAAIDKQVSVFETEKKAEELMNHVGVAEKIPAGADHSTQACEVCREPIDVVWDDDSEEWIFKSAASHNGKVIVSLQPPSHPLSVDCSCAMQAGRCPIVPLDCSQ